MIAPSDYLDARQTSAIARGQEAPNIVATLRSVLGSVTPGSALILPTGSIMLPSETLGGLGIKVPSGVRISGNGRQRTQLVVTGSQACRLFVTVDPEGTSVTDLSLIGNSESVGETVGAAIVAIASIGARVEGFRIERVHLENFAAPGWVHLISRENARFSRINISELSARSHPGNSLRPDLISHNSAVVRIDGFEGELSEICVSGLDIEAAYIKSAIVAYGAIGDMKISDCLVLNAGQHGAEDNKGAYAIQFYAAGRKMRNLSVSRCEISDPRSCGIYATTASGLKITDVRISGQTDLSDSTLPKGAVALNGTRNVEITRATLFDNKLGVSITSPRAGDVEIAIAISDCGILRCEKAGVFVRASRERGRYIGVSLNRCEISSKGPGIAVRNTLSAMFDEFELSSCRVVSNSFGIDLYQDAPTGPYTAKIANSHVRGASAAVRVRHAPALVVLAKSEFLSAAGRHSLDIADIESLLVRSCHFSRAPAINELRARGVRRVDLA